DPVGRCALAAPPRRSARSRSGIDPAPDRWAELLDRAFNIGLTRHGEVGPGRVPPLALDASLTHPHREPASLLPAFGRFGVSRCLSLEDRETRRAIARGQAIFNIHPIAITGVSGINDEAAFGKPTTLMGTCTSCHSTPNGGNHSVVAPLNIGLVDEA